MTRPTPFSGPLSMSAGEHRLLYAAPGSSWRSTAGCVRLTEPPRWIGDRLVAVDGVLCEGQVHVTEQGGWVMIRASTACVLVGAGPDLSRRHWPLRHILRWCALRSARLQRHLAWSD